ncbi:two component transcriptional regulator, winged-helix family [Rubidibacter lacunae KORDI 51-2]|uniref:Two component transcriptional regulator, winged-helix family n=1 Tax=Rubidibacter lacunae KORDI 51-2 TaxID=582515 RepID=U5DR09_9CHRO|nr:response regulator [Rubidibacter lacunae]ERN42110.1 two component transcriptional regulator, winged-helix family [Rubidibacter lacunae KORDI 51-2]
MAVQRILVIDDSRMIRMRIIDMLPTNNVEVIEARDGREGLELIRTQNPNLILLDFLLPKMSGWDVYREVQKQPQFRAIPLVVMSGRKEEVTEKLPEPFEHFAFIEKPFEKEQLIEAIKDARTKVTPMPKPADAPIAAAPVSDAAAAEVQELRTKVAALEKETVLLKKQLVQIVAFLKRKLR